MNWYSDYKNEWKKIIETVSAEIKKSELMIEKDTIQSMFLFELSKLKLPYVFKGGTSLSKVYNLIDRFSEDIDLSMNRKLTQSERKVTKEQLLKIAESLGMKLLNPNQIKSRHDYNKYVFAYDSLFSSIPMEIIIETSFYQSVYPIETQNAGSFVGKFCRDNGLILPIPFESANVKMNVQSLERTFIDKVFAICDYRIQDVQDRDSRHLYDIYKLLSKINFNKELSDLIDTVRDDRMMSKNNPSAQLEYNIPEMLKKIISSHFYERDYRDVTQKLLYENVDYNQAINEGITIVAKSDIFIYNKQHSVTIIRKSFNGKNN